MFLSRFHDRPHISLRRTKAAEIYRKTGNLRAVLLLLGLKKIYNTVRYLGVELEDALSIAERIDIGPIWASGQAVRHFEAVVRLSSDGRRCRAQMNQMLRVVSMAGIGTSAV